MCPPKTLPSPNRFGRYSSGKAEYSNPCSDHGLLSSAGTNSRRSKRSDARLSNESASLSAYPPRMVPVPRPGSCHLFRLLGGMAANDLHACRFVLGVGAVFAVGSGLLGEQRRQHVEPVSPAPPRGPFQFGERTRRATFDRYDRTPPRDGVPVRRSARANTLICRSERCTRTGQFTACRNITLGAREPHVPRLMRS
jgi:hypothetical protein